MGINLLKVNNRNTRTRCEKCSKLSIKIPEQHHWCCSSVFIVNFEHISHLVFIVNFEHVIADWVTISAKKHVYEYVYRIMKRREKLYGMI